MSNCNCINKCRIPGENTPKTSSHLFDCPALKKYLFYYEEAMDAWVSCPEKAEDFVTDLGEDEVEIRFKRIRMSEDEFENLPQD